MAAVTLNQRVFSVSVPVVDTEKFKQLIKLMGWKFAKSKEPARLSHPICRKRR